MLFLVFDIIKFWYYISLALFYILFISTDSIAMQLPVQLVSLQSLSLSIK